MMRLPNQSAYQAIMIFVILASFCCILFLFQYYASETRRLQDKKNEALQLIDAWTQLESSTKDLVIAEDLLAARRQWKQSIAAFDKRLALFIGSHVIGDLRQKVGTFDSKVRETENMWRIMKPRIEYVQPRLDDYIGNQNQENKRSLLYELLFQVEQNSLKQDYMTLFDLTFDINYMVSSLSSYFISVLKGTVDSISETIDKKTLQVRYMVFCLSVAIVIITIVFLSLSQQSLRQSQERFRQVVELSPFAIYIVGHRSRIEYINPKFEEVFGYTLEDIPTLSDWAAKAFSSQADRSAVEMFWDTGQTETPGAGSSQRTLQVRCRDGSWRNIVFRQVETADRKHFVICEDITERKRAEEALRESERKFRAIFDQTFQFIGLLDTAGNLLAINKTALDYIRGNDRDVLGKAFWETPWWDHSVSEQEKLQAAIRTAATGQLARFETTNRSFDGSLVYLDVSIKPVCDELGRVVLLIPEGRDITQRKQAEEQRTMFSYALEQANDLIKIIGVDGTIKYINPAAEHITGFTNKELLGQNPFALKLKEDDTLYATMLETIRTGQSWSGHQTNVKKDGTVIEIETTLSPIRNTAGEIIGYVAISRDVTEMLRMEERLRQAQKMEAIGTLAGGIAHDFNNILAAIIGYAEMTLVNLPQNSSVAHNLGQILKAGDRAKALVKQILSFSRKQQKTRVHADVRAIVQESFKLLRASIPTTIEIRERMPSEACMVSADPIQLHQILMNLCTNAAQAMAEHGGVLDVGLAVVELGPGDARQYAEVPPGAYIRLSVSDRGTGIDHQIINRIFDPFFTTKEVGQGTGMGLAVVHGIVKDHGGAIAVDSEPGRGTTFHVVLPRLPAGTGVEHVPEKRVLNGAEKILLVDDEEMLVDVISSMLTTLGYTVVSARSSLEALEIFRADPGAFDAVLSDQTMPHMTGYELSKKLLSIRHDIPVVLCTGFSERVSEEKAQAAGISAYVMKPVSMRELAVTMRKVLDSISA